MSEKLEFGESYWDRLPFGESYWDRLPEEIKRYILHLREDQYRHKYRKNFVKVLRDISKIGMIKSFGFVHVKITTPSGWKVLSHSFDCPDRGSHRQVRGYFCDLNGDLREVFISNCLCAILTSEIQMAWNMCLQSWHNLRIPLFWDEWNYPLLAKNYILPTVLRSARARYGRSEHARGL